MQKNLVVDSTEFVFVERHIRNTMANGYKLIIHCKEYTSRMNKIWCEGVVMNAQFHYSFPGNLPPPLNRMVSPFTYGQSIIQFTVFANS